jgi:hypothetical protein
MAVVRLVAVLMPVAVRAAAALAMVLAALVMVLAVRLIWAAVLVMVVAALVMAAEAARVMVAEASALRLGRRVVRNCLLGQHRLHWKLLAVGPIPRSMDQRLLLMSLAPTIFDAEQWWCQVPIAGKLHCSKND